MPENAISNSDIDTDAEGPRPFYASVWVPSTHILELDGLRGLAILIVTINRFAKHVPTETTAGFISAKVFEAGERGVDLFFVLSGFLITGVLLDARERAGFFRKFFARRTLRIFPLYFSALFGFLVLVPAIWPVSHPFRLAQEQQFYLWTYLANVRQAMVGEWCLGSLDHFWSLAVEEHFYLMWPFVVWMLGREKTFKFAVMFAIVCTVARIAFATLSENSVASDVMSFFRFDGLLLGAAVACVAREPGGLQRFIKLARHGVLLSFLAILMVTLMGGRVLTISHSVWAVFWTCVLVTLLCSPVEGQIAGLFRWSGMRSLGKYSYAMYVFQSPLIPLLGGMISAAGIATMLNMNPGYAVLPTIIYTIIMFIVSYAMAIFSWHLLEKHCLKLKRYF